MNRKLRAVSGLTLAAFAVLVVGCAGENGADESAQGAQGEGAQAGTMEDADVEALYEAALEEGSVTWYSSAPADTPEDFEAAFPGIDVEFIRLPAGQLGTRYAQERDAGAMPADFITIADERFILDGRERGWFETDLDLPALEAWPDDAFSEGMAIMGIGALGLGYNSDLVPNPPQTWEEVLDPEFVGRIQNGDPRGAPVYLAMMYVLREEFGSDFLQQIADMEPAYEASMVSVNQNLAAGAASISMTDSYQLVKNLADEGAPLELQDMSPTTGSIHRGVISTDTANPNAARLLMNFLMTPEGQNSFAADKASVLGVDLVPNSIPLAEGWREVSVEELDAVRADILSDLGLH